MLAAVVVTVFAVTNARMDQARHGETRLPDLFGDNVDLRIVKSRGAMLLDAMPIWGLDAIGRALCAAGKVNAFGELGVIVDSQFNVPARLHCGEGSRVILGGLPDRDAVGWFLAHRDAVSEREAPRQVGGFRLGTVDAIPFPVAASRSPTVPIILHDRARARRRARIASASSPGRRVSSSSPPHCRSTARSASIV